MIQRIRDSRTGEVCPRSETVPLRADLSPGDGLCPNCLSLHALDEVADIKAAIRALRNYLDHEDPHGARLTDEAAAEVAALVALLGDGKAVA